MASFCATRREMEMANGTKFVCAVHSTKTGGWYATCRHASAKLCVVSTFFSCHSRYVDCCCCCCCRRYCCVAYVCVCVWMRTCMRAKQIENIVWTQLECVFGFGCRRVRACVYASCPECCYKFEKEKETIFRSHRRCKMFLQWFRCCYCRRSHVKVLLLHARARVSVLCFFLRESKPPFFPSLSSSLATLGTFGLSSMSRTVNAFFVNVSCSVCAMSMTRVLLKQLFCRSLLLAVHVVSVVYWRRFGFW